MREYVEGVGLLLNTQKGGMETPWRHKSLKCQSAQLSKMGRYDWFPNRPGGQALPVIITGA